MEDTPEYKSKKLSFSEYLNVKGIKDKALLTKMKMHRETFIKRKEKPQDFTWAEIKQIAEHLNMTESEFIKSFLE